MHAVKICTILSDSVSGKIITGVVHSVFQNACNLVSNQDDMFITLLSHSKMMSPMSLVLDMKQDFRNLGIHQGSSFCISNSEVVLPEAELYIGLLHAERWYSGCDLDTDTAGISLENMRAFENILFAGGRFSGMESLLMELQQQFPELGCAHLGVLSAAGNEYKANSLSYEFIKNRFIRFMEEYIRGNIEGIHEHLAGIIGFGAGLTPSMDDFINGLLAVNTYMTKFQKIQTEKAVAFHNRMLNGLLGKTTRVSGEMLKNGALGLQNEAVKNLMTQLLAGNPNTVGNATAAAIDYGQTSGTDTALGIYTGLKIWTNYDYRRVVLNEYMRGN